MKEDTASFKYFPGDTTNKILFYVEGTFGKFDTAKIHIGIHDVINNTAGTGSLLPNILKRAARWKMHGISKIFEVVAKLNLNIANIF